MYYFIDGIQSYVEIYGDYTLHIILINMRSRTDPFGQNYL